LQGLDASLGEGEDFGVGIVDPQHPVFRLELVGQVHSRSSSLPSISATHRIVKTWVIAAIAQAAAARKLRFFHSHGNKP
jgi:hypothetical protein